jgi:hypothetical protein
MRPSSFRLNPKERALRSINHITSNFGHNRIGLFATLGYNAAKHRIVRVTSDLIAHLDHVMRKVARDLRHIVLPNGVPIIRPLQRRVHSRCEGHEQNSSDTGIEARGKVERLIKIVSQIGREGESSLIAWWDRGKSGGLYHNCHILVVIEHHIRREARIERGDILKIPEGLEILNRRGRHDLALKMSGSSVKIDTSHLESLRPG